MYSNSSDAWVKSELRASLLEAAKRGAPEVFRILADGRVPLPPALMADSRYLGCADIVKDILNVSMS